MLDVLGKPRLRLRSFLDLQEGGPTRLDHLSILTVVRALAVGL